MPLELKIISDNAELVGDDAVRAFNQRGGTIGRSLRSDWILPDPSRFVSSSHATIDFKAGAYYLADTSSNGVFINKEAKPIGKGKTRRLSDGDQLRIGYFEILVSLSEKKDPARQSDADSGSASSEHLEQFVDSDVLASGMKKLIDEEAMSGEEEFQATLISDPDETDVAPSSADLPDRLPIRDGYAGSTARTTEAAADDLFDSFLVGLGVSRAELGESLSRPEMMLTAGQVLREFVAGTRNLLASRADLKNTFRLDQTTVLPRNNNPMKFTENTNDLLKQLLTGTENEYLGAQESIREVCRDLIEHQNAFLDAMSSAFLDFAERFEPTELQEGFDRSINSKLFRFRNKTKYWQLYSELYPILTEKGGGRFPQMFAEDFVEAYEQEVARYRSEAPYNSPSLPPTPYPPEDPEGMASTQIMGEVEEPEPEPRVHPATPTESAFEEDDIVDVLSAESSVELDQGFIEDLEKCLAAEPQGKA